MQVWGDRGHMPLSDSEVSSAHKRESFLKSKQKRSLSWKDLVPWKDLFKWWNWRRGRKGLIQFLHRLKNLQGLQQLGIISSYRWDGRYQPSMPAGRFLLHLKMGGLFPLKIDCRLYLYPKMLPAWCPMSKPALCWQARSCWHLLPPQS